MRTPRVLCIIAALLLARLGALSYGAPAFHATVADLWGSRYTKLDLFGLDDQGAYWRHRSFRLEIADLENARGVGFRIAARIYW